MAGMGLLCLAFGLAGAPPPAARPFDIGGRAQLFVDRVLVKSVRNVTFTLHPANKHPANPLIKVDKPWEGWRLALCGSVIYDADERLFKMWYLGGRNGSLYATSSDGIRWRKHERYLKNCVFTSVMKDEADADPARRYKIVGWAKNPPGCQSPMRWGYHALTSADGLTGAWVSRDKPICPGSDVISAYYDRQRKLYVAFPKTMTRLGKFNRRCFSVITSSDFVRWTGPKLAFVPDARDEAGSGARIEAVRALLDVPDDPRRMRTDFYGIGVYQHESCTLAFPWMLTINNNGRYGNHEGPGEVQLAASRDLVHWDRSFREPCIPRGKIGEWDCGFFETCNEAIRVGDEIRLYYSGANYTHGAPCLYRAKGTGRLTRCTGGIGLATWRLDRFVSADAGPEGGVLTTVPVVFSGRRLELNAAARADGRITVELLDAPGGILARSAPMTGDRLRHRVAWLGDVDVASLAGRPVTLRFHLRAAQLYSFAFRQ